MVFFDLRGTKKLIFVRKCAKVSHIKQNIVATRCAERIAIYEMDDPSRKETPIDRRHPVGRGFFVERGTMIAYGFEVFRNIDGDITIRQRSFVDPDEYDVVVVSQHEASILAKAICDYIYVTEDSPLSADSRGGV